MLNGFGRSLFFSTAAIFFAGRPSMPKTLATYSSRVFVCWS